jgi:hypothetical protein
MTIIFFKVFSLPCSISFFLLFYIRKAEKTSTHFFDRYYLYGKYLYEHERLQDKREERSASKEENDFEKPGRMKEKPWEN